MSNLLISEPPLQVLPSLAVKVGLNEAMILQQFHYWSNYPTVTIDGHGWVSRSLAELEKAFPFWSAKTIQRAIARLRDEGYLRAYSTATNAFDKTLSYRVDYDKLGSSIGTICPSLIWTNCPDRSGQDDQITIYRKELKKEKREKATSSARSLTMKEWLDALKQSGEKAIREDDPIHAWAEDAGIPDDFMVLAWKVFRDQAIESQKKQADWPATFRNYVRRDWLKLWAFDRNGQCFLTTSGKQMQAFYSNRQKVAA